MHYRGNGVLKEEKSLEEIHKIREKISKMDKEERERKLKEIRKKYKDLF